MINDSNNPLSARVLTSILEANISPEIKIVMYLKNLSSNPDSQMLKVSDQLVDNQNQSFSS